MTGFEIDPSPMDNADEPLYVVMDFHGKVLLLSAEGDDEFLPLHRSSVDPFLPKGSVFPLGRLSGSSIALLLIDSSCVGIGRWLHLPLALMASDEDTFALLSTARQVAVWDREHQYCGMCGAKNEEVAAHAERYKWCSACQQPWYPRISPCMICVIIKDDKLLLAKNRHSSGGWYSALAGFLEPGESVEQAVHREVEEEVGLKVTDLQYFSSQAWSFPHQLMLGFICRYESGEIILGEDEIEDAQWFDCNDLPKIPPVRSLSGQLIQRALEIISPLPSDAKG